MCGRFQISKVVDEVQIRFHVDVELEWFRQVFNAAPSMILPVITNAEPQKLNFFKWGLIPFWAKDPLIGNKMINARAETLKEKPSFRNALKSRRCLVPSDGFYEWKKIPGGKQPYRLCLQDESLYAYAGLWELWKDEEGKEIHSFTIITTAANPLVADIHDRMPVILEPDFEKHWLDPQFPANEALEFLQPFPAERMKVYPVSKNVNNVRNNSPELMDILMS
jgi:putative SOS response-associated peptidase YedK